MHSLPPLPRGIRALTTDEGNRLEAMGVEYHDPEHCITCRGTGEFRWYAPGRESVVTYKCDCVAQYLLHRLCEWCGLGKAYQRLAWGDIANETAGVDAARNYCDIIDEVAERGIGLIFHGQRGTGKTLLSALILKHAIAQGHDGYFATFAGIMEMFMSGFRKPDEQAWFNKRVRNTKLLVVDDLGAERRVSGDMRATDSTGFAQSLVDEILRWRVGHALPTIITMNPDPDDKDFAKKYGVRVMSLLCEGSIMYRFEGDDFRTQQQERTLAEMGDHLIRPIVVG